MQYRILRVLLVAMVMTIDKQVGGCTAIRQTHKMIEDCKNGDSGVIFYSFNESEPLVDIFPSVTTHTMQFRLPLVRHMIATKISLKISWIR